MYSTCELRHRVQWPRDTPAVSRMTSEPASSAGPTIGQV
jgi:hypothetical protein